MAGGKSKEPSKDSIKVFLRVRPRVQHEVVENHSCKNLTCDPTDKTIVRVRDPRNAQSSDASVDKKFAFHEVFPAESTQEHVFNSFAKECVEDALQGYHGVMFVYGQTGSGKTFTMSHNEKGKEGMLQRSMQAVWKHVAEDSEWDYDLSVSYVQLYNEMLSDMLEPSQNNAVRLSGVADRRNDVTLLNDTTQQAISRPVSGYDETIKMFETGLARRVSASTSMNAVSSRSHTVFTLYIKKQAKNERSDGGIPKCLEGRLIICDLAGSERIKKTEAVGNRMTEATHINGSLLVLGRVVAALTDPKTAQHVPYRESKLTRLLQYSLSGWGKTRLVVNVSPSDYNTEETLGAIAFGQRAIQIKQSAEKHETLDYKALYLELQRQIDKQRDEILRETIVEHEQEKKRLAQDYTDRIEMLEAEISVLKQQLAESMANGGGGGGATAGATGAGGGAALGGHSLPGAATSIGGHVATNISLEENSVHNISHSELSPSRHTFDGMNVAEILLRMKERMKARDERLAEAEKTTQSLREQLDLRERQLLQVANKLRTHQLKSEETRMFLEKNNAELSEKLSAATGVEYLTVQKIDGNDTPVPMESPRPSNASPSPSDTTDVDEANEKLYKVIHVLQSRLNEASAYNRTSRRAIQMLHCDLESAQAENARLAGGRR
jgi:hypothetical protein